MIVVNLTKSYKDVLEGTRSLEEVTLGDWFRVNDEAIQKYGDVIAGIHKEIVVSVFKIDDYSREDERVTFTGHPSTEFHWLIGEKSPAKPWVRGQGRPIQYLDTETLRGAPVEKTATHLRAEVSGYILMVDPDGHAYIEPPVGGIVTVLRPSEDRVFLFSA